MTTPFQANQISHFEEFPTEIQERILILPCYIAQIALAQTRIGEIDDQKHCNAALAFTDAREGELFLIQWMKVEVFKIAWQIVLQVPDIEIIHPAIQIVRDLKNWQVIDIQIAEDLSQWLPKEASLESVV